MIESKKNNFMRFKNSKNWNLIIDALVLFPFINMISLLSFYLHTAIIIGHLPIPSLDDPKNLLIYYFYEPIILMSFLANIICLFLWLLGALTWNLITINPITWKPVLIRIALQIIVVYLLFSDISVWLGD